MDATTIDLTDGFTEAHGTPIVLDEPAKSLAQRNTHTVQEYMTLKKTFSAILQRFGSKANAVLKLDGVSSATRKVAHTVAGALGWRHESSGDGSSRVLILKAPRSASSAPLPAAPHGFAAGPLPQPPAKCLICDSTTMSPVRYSSRKDCFTVSCRTSGGKHEMDHCGGRWMTAAQRRARPASQTHGSACGASSVQDLKDEPVVPPSQRNSPGSSALSGKRILADAIGAATAELVESKTKVRLLEKANRDKVQELVVKENEITKARETHRARCDDIKKARVQLQEQCEKTKKLEASLRAQQCQIAARDQSLSKMSTETAKIQRCADQHAKDAQRCKQVAAQLEFEAAEAKRELEVAKAAASKATVLAQMQEKKTMEMQEALLAKQAKQEELAAQLAAAQQEVDRAQASRDALQSGPGTVTQESTTSQALSDLTALLEDGPGLLLPATPTSTSKCVAQGPPMIGSFSALAPGLASECKPVVSLTAEKQCHRTSITEHDELQGLGRREQKRIAKEGAWEKFNHELCERKIVEPDGTYKIKCSRCPRPLICKKADPTNFTQHVNAVHVRSGWRPRPSATLGPQGIFAFAGWKRASVPKEAPPERVQSQDVPVTANKVCSGILRSAVEQAAKATLRNEVADAVGPIPIYKHYVEACLALLKSSNGIRLTWGDGEYTEIKCKGQCDEHVARRQDGGRLHITCKGCTGLERLLCKSAASLRNVFNARILLAYSTRPEAWQIQVLAPVDHCSQQGQKQWHAAELLRIKYLARARRHFLEFKRDDGGIVGDDIADDDLQMLKRTQIALLTNAGGIRTKALKGAWAAYVSLLARKEVGQGSHPARGNRYEDAWRAYSLASYHLSTQSALFTRANLLEGAMMTDRHARLQSDYENYLDASDETLQARTRKQISQLKSEGEKLVVIMADELAAMAALTWCGKLGRLLGCAGEAAALEEEDAMKSKIPTRKLADKVKFSSITGSVQGTVMTTCMRPGHADAKDEEELNTRHMSAIMSAARESDVKVAGIWFDGIAKEKKTVFDSIVRYVSASTADRCSVVYLAGVDLKHQLKSGRNRAAFGSTVAPHLGFLVVNISVFGYLGAKIDNLRIKDQFSDFRVEALLRHLKDFPSMLTESGRPTSEVLGTLLYFYAMHYARTCVFSQSSVFDKRSRLFGLHWSLRVLTSYKIPAVTFKNWIACLLPLCFVLCLPECVRLARMGTGMLEYFFGLMRVRSNSDMLTVQHMMENANKMTALQELLRKYGWVSGRRARQYGVNLDEKHKRGAFAKEGETISDIEHLNVMNEASEAVKSFLTKRCQATEAEISPMCRKYASMTELAAHLMQQFQVAPTCEAEDEDTALAHHATRSEGDAALNTILHNVEHLDKSVDDKFEELRQEISTSVEPAAEVAPAAAVFFQGLESMAKSLHNVSCSDAIAALSNCASFLDDACEADAHKGLAGRRNILERLKLTATRLQEQESAAVWGLDSVVYHPASQSFYRILTIFERSYRRWILVEEPSSERERLRQVRNCNNQSHRANLELVGPCSHKPDGGIAWMSKMAGQNRARCLNVFLGDVYILPGDHFVKQEVDQFTSEKSGLGFTMNIAAALRKDLEIPWGVELDSRRVGAVVALLSLLQQGASSMNALILKATGLGAIVKTCLDAPVHEVKEAGKSVVEAWKVVKATAAWSRA